MTTAATWLIRAVAASIAAVVAGTTASRSHAAALRLGATGCAPASALEEQWHGTGEWRRLAPYPVPREASPTDSVGVWLERWHLANGSTELRRVSAAITLVASLSPEDCDVRVTRHVRSFDSATMAHAFTDERLRELLTTTRDGMIYVWSPGMPLSITGLREAKAAADSLGIAFSAVVADARAGEISAAHVDATYQQTLNSFELVYRNATIHYPTAIFYRAGSLLGSAIPGYKTRDAYVALARSAFETGDAGGAAAPMSARPAPTFWVDHKARLSMVRAVETVRPVGFFFKPIATTDLVSYTSSNAAFIFDLGTRREQRIPGTVDPVPTPDGKFLTRPGLIFYPIPTLATGDTTPFFVDKDLPDEYQTISILKQGRDAARYRVVTGWRTGLRLRHYDVSFTRDGKPQRIEALGTPMVPCPDRVLVLPISAKGSREVGVFDKRSNTNRIIEVTDDGKCVDVLDLGFASGKLSFNYDGSAIAFATSRIDVDADGFMLQPEEAFYKDALVLYRKTGRIVSLSRNRGLRGMTFPDFLPDGRSIILDQASRLRPTEYIRVLEVK